MYSMKIKKIEGYMFYPGAAKNILLCRMETENGAYGWGEAYVVRGKEHVTKYLLEAMAPVLLGRSVYDVRHMRSMLFNDYAIKRNSVDLFSVISAFEIASWDIIGKLTGQPIYNLLGGRHRERVRVYANGWWKGANTIDETVKRVMKLKEEGWNAVKWDPFRGPWREQLTRAEENYAVENVRAVREAAGPDMDLLIEVHRRLSPYNAIHFADRIAEFDPFVLEEPCLSDNIDAVAEVRRNVSIPVMTGETMYTKMEMKSVLEARAADYINPDTCCTGGITGMMELAAMAEPYSVQLSPHNYNSTVIGLAATVHISAMVPNFNIAECFVNIKPGCDSVAQEPLVVDNGFIELPTKPGLGVDIDLEKMKQMPWEKITLPTFPQYTFEYPRKEDYVK